MKIMRYVVLMLTAVCSAVAVNAHTPVADSGNRVILKAARPITAVELQGASVVELKPSAQHAGYILYHTSNNDAPRIKATSFDDGRLVIAADSTANAISTRITVLYQPGALISVSNQGGVIVGKEIAGDKLIMSSIGATGIFFNKVDACELIINNANSRMGFAKMHCNKLITDVSGGSTFKVLDFKGQDMIINTSGTSNIDMAGRVDKMIVKSGNQSTINAKRLKCARLIANIEGSGNISCDVTTKAIVNQVGSGKLVMKRYPRELEKNVDTDIIIIEK